MRLYRVPLRLTRLAAALAVLFSVSTLCASLALAHLVRASFLPKKLKGKKLHVAQGHRQRQKGQGRGRSRIRRRRRRQTLRQDAQGHTRSFSDFFSLVLSSSQKSRHPRVRGHSTSALPKKRIKLKTREREVLGSRYSRLAYHRLSESASSKRESSALWTRETVSWPFSHQEMYFFFSVFFPPGRGAVERAGEAASGASVSARLRLSRGIRRPTDRYLGSPLWTYFQRLVQRKVSRAIFSVDRELAKAARLSIPPSVVQIVPGKTTEIHFVKNGTHISRDTAGLGHITRNSVQL